MEVNVVIEQAVKLLPAISAAITVLVLIRQNIIKHKRPMAEKQYFNSIYPLYDALEPVLY